MVRMCGPEAGREHRVWQQHAGRNWGNRLHNGNGSRLRSPPPAPAAPAAAGRSQQGSWGQSRRRGLGHQHSRPPAEAMGSQRRLWARGPLCPASTRSTRAPRPQPLQPIEPWARRRAGARATAASPFWVGGRPWGSTQRCEAIFPAAEPLALPIRPPATLTSPGSRLTKPFIYNYNY